MTSKKDPAVLLNQISHLQISITKLEKDPNFVQILGKKSAGADEAAYYNARIVLDAAKERLKQMEADYQIAIVAQSPKKEDEQC